MNNEDSKARDDVCTTFLATLLGLGLVPCVDAFAKSNTSQSGDTISLSGSDWRIHEDVDGNGAERRLFAADASSSEWIAATVPGNIQADLEAARLLRPLWYGLGDDIRLGKAAEKDWRYRKDFTAPAGWTGKRVQLVFDGVDHECEIFLNNQRVGGFAGMFRKMAYDVSGQLRPGQVNHLAVRIARSPASLVPHVGKPTIIKLYRHVLGDVKSPTNFGLDWGIGIYTLGIWKDVYLEATGPARIDSIQVQTRLSDGYGKAAVTARLEINSLTNIRGKARFRRFPVGQQAEATAQLDADLKKGPSFLTAHIAARSSGPGGPTARAEPAAVHAGGDTWKRRTARCWNCSGTARFGVREIRWKQVEVRTGRFHQPVRNW